jgi:hypothetical protein
MSAVPHITHDNTGGHAAFFYETPEERLSTLAMYFLEGIADNELCVFVTADKPSDAVKKFKKYGADFRFVVKDGSLRILEMDSTYLPGGTFAADYALSNLKSYQQEAAKLGYSGLRTAGEMSWLYDHHDAAHTEAAAYEQRINKPPVANSKFIGLCLYPVQEHFTRVLRDVARTHPSLIYGGKITPSSLYAH